MNTLARCNTGLLAITLILAAILWFKPGLNEVEAIPITTLDVTTVQKATIFHRGKQHIVLERNGSDWRMTEPENAEITAWRVDRLLHIAVLPSLRKFPIKTDQLEEFGLKIPVYTLQLDNLQLQFGNVDPVTRLRYVLAGDQIHLITDSYSQYLLAPAEKWLAK